MAAVRTSSPAAIWRAACWSADHCLNRRKVRPVAALNIRSALVRSIFKRCASSTVGRAPGWAPCIGPTYSAVQLLSLSGGSSAAKGAFLAFVYSLGLGIPFLLIALAVRRGIGVMSFFRNHRLAIQRTGGGILILLGILMASGV